MSKKDKKESSHNLSEMSLLSFAESAVERYGKMTIEDRALPDYRDGFKPVHRRVMWTMFKAGLWPNGPFRKVAKVVGDTMGNYHPHGDMPIGQALVGMANLSVPLIWGQGNYGNAYTNDNAAASRYIECKLTKFAAQNIVNPDYMAVAPLHPNYDGLSQEPLYIPAIVPNLLLNGTYGIAVGATSIIPPFKAEGVFALVERALNGEKITAKMCAKKLKINYPLGGQYNGDDETLLEFFKTGKAGLRLSPDYEVSASKKTITITGAPFGVNIDKIVDRIAEHPKVSNIDNMSDGSNPVKTLIRLKNTVAEKEVESVAAELIEKISATLAAAVSVTVRESEKEKTFLELNVPEIIQMWAAYRVDLEKRMQEHRIQNFDNRISLNKLYVLAANNRKIILAALEDRDPAKVISKKLKLTEDDANKILDLQIRRLSRLSEDELNKTIAGLQKERKDAIGIKKNPNTRIMELLNKAA